MPEAVVPDVSLFVSASSASEDGDARQVHTCSRCQYSGPLQVRHSYPLILCKPVIVAAFCCGILPGLLLRSWRRKASPTVAITCPQCALRRLELKPSEHHPG